MERKNLNINRGAASILFLFLLLFILLFSRFLYIEVTKKINGKELNALAQEKWTATQVIEAQRGTIYDRKGNILAQNIPSYTIYAILDRSHPNHVEDPSKTAEQLAPLLNAPQEEIEQRLSQEGPFQVEFGSYGRKLTQAKKNEIEQLGLKGIGFVREAKRYYPNQLFASHVIGFTNEDDGQEGQVGMMGLEKSLNDHLAERNGKITFKRDRTGVKLPMPDEKMLKPKHGRNVYLTIDENIQLFAEQALDETVREYEPERAIVIVVNPKTGEVLALGSRPSFNPNKRDITNYSNDAISSRFEPGSTMKIFTLAAAIEEGVYNGKEVYQSGRYKVAGGMVRDHNDGLGWGTIPFDEGVRRSSNVAFSKLVKEKLGFERFHQYLLKFGFDKRTGIDLPDEVNGTILYNYELEKVNASFGQGTAITPIQQVQAATAIANKKGHMMRPYVVKKIVDSETDETIEETEPTIVNKPISANTAEKVIDLLGDVVTRGTGTPFAIEGYDIAGKTGTAQIPSPTGGYLKGWGKNIYSFIGMAPKDDPTLLVYTAIDRPKLEGYETGSQATAKLFKTIMQSSLQYLNIFPDEEKNARDKREEHEQGITLEDYSGMTLQQVTNELSNLGLKVVALGDPNSKISQQNPFPMTSVLAEERIILKSSGTFKLPNLQGWSLADVLKLADVLRIDIDIKGSGYVRKQSIQTGEAVRAGDKLTLELSYQP